MAKENKVKTKKEEATKGKKPTKPKHNNAFEMELSEDVLAELGANKKDLELIEDIGDDDDEVLDCGEDLESEPIKRDEVREFIEELGFKDIMEDLVEDNENDEDTAAKDNEEKKIDYERKKEERKKEKKKHKYKDIQIGEVSSTTDIGDMSFVDNYTARKHLLLKLFAKWFNSEVSSVQAKPAVPTGNKMEKLLSYVIKLYQDEVNLYKKKQEMSKSSEAAWLRTVLTSGTLKDKMAAWTLRIQEAPVHNIAYLEHLITMVSKKGRREAIMALDTVKELFLSELLPDDRKLRTFDQNPLTYVEKLASGNKDSRDRRLILWYFEDKLKEKYAEFIQGLETLCHDSVRAAKQKALTTVFVLLASKPEQEKKLLSILTNKLGDPDYKIASNAAHLLKSLVERHPNMKQVIIADVERLVYRPNVSQKAQYYAVCFLNQILLNNDEDELALRLINIYFSFFKAFIKKGEVDSKMLAALLTGVNRSYPYAKRDQMKIADHVDTLYKVIHLVNFNTSVQALMLLYQVTESSDSNSDRFYQALYKKILDPGLVTSSKQALFLNLLYKSMKRDMSERRVRAFIKRLLQVCSCLPPPIICGTLILLSELLKIKPSLFQFVQMSQESDDEDEHFEDAPDEDGDNAKNNKDHKPSVNTDATASWIHKKNVHGINISHSYNPHHRNPLYCNADCECVWELVSLTQHYHPTVALFAKNILKREAISYQGDPLEDFTLIRFLDRFVYRNPKKREKSEDVNKKMHSHLESKSKHHVAEGAKALPVNSEKYLQIDLNKIPVDEKFFYRYFTNRAKKKKENVDEEIDSDVDDDEFERYLDDYEKGLDGADLKFDFAGEFCKSKLTKKAGKQKHLEDEEADDDDDDDDIIDDEDDDVDMDDDLSDEEVDFTDDDRLMSQFRSADSDLDESAEGEFDEEDIAFSDNDEFDLKETSSSDRKPGKAGRKRLYKEDDTFLDEASVLGRKKRKSTRFDQANLFAAAEEFAEVIDDNTSKLSMIGSNALSNKDNADAKQLKWEMERDRWMTDRDWKTKKRAKHHQKGHRFGSKFHGKQQKRNAKFKGKAKKKGKN